MNWGAPAFAVVTVGPLPPDAAVTIEAAGGQVEAAFGWDDLDALGGSATVIAAAPADIGHGALERLAAILDERGLDALVLCEAGTLDVVAAVLMGRVALLCDPEPSDWAIELASAALRAAPAAVREGEAERLRQLNTEVARIAGLLAALVEEPEAGEVADRRTSFGAEPAGEVAIDAAEIRRVIRARRLRGAFFDRRLVEDPGWDMLLDLFAAELEGGQVSVSSLCIASGVATTTALRWITRMAGAGLLERVADPGDRRRAFLRLSAPASAAMRGYVAAVRRAGLGLA